MKRALVAAALLALASCARPVAVPAPAAARPLSPAEIAQRDARFAEAWKAVKAQLPFGPIDRAPQPASWIERRQLARASEAFPAVIALDPGWWQPWWALGKVYQRLDRAGDAMTCFGRALERAPAEARATVAADAGAAARQAGDDKTAIRFYEIALRADPENPSLVANLALAHLAAGNVAVARQLITDALAASPDDPGLRRALGRVEERELGKNDGAPLKPPDGGEKRPTGALAPTLAPLLVPATP